MQRFGGIDGNSSLTSAAAVVLTGLLLAEGVTLLDLNPLRTPHMFIGLLLLPPLLVKLGSTGYRFVRYYTGAAAYRLQGPPATPLRLIAPLLVAATIGIFATGIALLALGHRSGTLVGLHKLSFIVWSAAFGVHFLAHLPKMLRSVAATRAVPGAGVRLTLVGASVIAGLGLALAVLGPITSWVGGGGGDG
jgi:hypothetical protein